MNTIFRKVCNAAGIGPELQARDLRRTAAVRLREADCSDLDIVAITGHSIERTKQILQTYLPPTTVASFNAVAKWERNESMAKAVVSSPSIRLKSARGPSAWCLTRAAVSPTSGITSR